MTRYVGLTSIPGWDGPDGMDALFEKGDLLYEEFDKGPILQAGLAFSAVFCGLGAITILIGLLVTAYAALDRVLFICFGSIFVILGVVLVVMAIKYTPFRVYKGGVTLTNVTFRDGLAGRETFVPVGSIKEVTYGWVPSNGGCTGFRFHLEEGEDFNVSVTDPKKLTRVLFQVLWCPVEGPV